MVPRMGRFSSTDKGRAHCPDLSIVFLIQPSRAEWTHTSVSLWHIGYGCIHSLTLRPRAPTLEPNLQHPFFFEGGLKGATTKRLSIRRQLPAINKKKKKGVQNNSPDVNNINRVHKVAWTSMVALFDVV